MPFEASAAVTAMPSWAPASGSATLSSPPAGAAKSTRLATRVPTAPTGAPASSLTAMSAGEAAVSRTGASLTGVTVMDTVSVSVSAPPAPVLPWSSVVTCERVRTVEVRGAAVGHPIERGIHRGEGARDMHRGRAIRGAVDEGEPGRGGQGEGAVGDIEVDRDLSVARCRGARRLRLPSSEAGLAFAIVHAGRLGRRCPRRSSAQSCSCAPRSVCLAGRRARRRLLGELRPHDPSLARRPGLKAHPSPSGRWIRPSW